MQHTDILLEYNRDQTVKNYGEKLIAAVAKDRSVANQLIGQFPPDSNMQKVVKTPEGQQIIINYLLDQLEATDPTANKQYTQWIARTYAKGGFQVEDLINQVAPLMAKFAACSMKKSIKQQYNTIAWDINQYKDFGSFMDAAEQLPNPNAVPAAAISQEDAGKYKLLTPPGSGCTVVELIDEKSAGYFGLYKQPNETRWCTRRYGESGNQFDYYNGKGPLFVIIPDVPEHTGERYQFHFESKQFMDEKDHQIGETGIASLSKRYPILTKIFAIQAFKFNILGLKSLEYQATVEAHNIAAAKAVKAHAKVVAPQLAKLITEKVKIIANPQVENRKVSFALLNDYNIELDPTVKTVLVGLIESFLLQARDALVAKDGFWSKVVNQPGTESDAKELQRILTADSTLRSLAHQSPAGLMIKQILDSNKKWLREIDAVHMQDILLLDPLFRVIIRMVPPMYVELKDDLHSQLVSTLDMIKENRYDDNRTGFRRSRPDVTGEEEPGGIFTVMIDGRAWKTATSNEAFRMAANVARKYPNKLVQVKWPNGALNTVKEETEEFIWSKPHPNAKLDNAKVKVSPYIWDRPHPNAKPNDAKVKVSPYIWDRPHPNAKPVKGVAEGFNSKQEMIAHFVATGRTAAQGAAAWERTQGKISTKKKPNPFDPNYKFKPMDNSRYGEKDLDEGIFGSKPQPENFEFYLDGCDAHAVKKYLLNKFGSRGWQVFAAGGGTSKTFVTMTPGLYPTDNEAKWDIEANCGQSIAEDDWHSEQVGNAWHGTGNDATDAWHGASSGGPMVETKSKPLIRKVERKRADDSVETTYELIDINGRTLKTGMSKESALSALKAYRAKHVNENKKQYKTTNKQDFARLVAISESIKGKKR